VDQDISKPDVEVSPLQQTARQAVPMQVREGVTTSAPESSRNFGHHRT